MESPGFTALATRVGYTFNDVALLADALTHRSYLNEQESAVSSSNQRMEFLGDAVLGLVMTEMLYRAFPSFAEGTLSIIRSRLVSGAHLASLAGSIRLGEAVLLGKGEERLGGRDKASILSSMFESFVAAVYLDGGIEPARRIIEGLYRDEMARIARSDEFLDDKSRLQKVSQARFGLMPAYEVVAEAGPDHRKRFTVRVAVGDAAAAEGTGKSKKEAEQQAARQALKALETA